MNKYVIKASSQKQKDSITKSLLDAGLVLYKGFSLYPKTVEEFRLKSPHRQCPNVIFESSGYIATWFENIESYKRDHTILDYNDKEHRKIFKNFLKEFKEKNKLKFSQLEVSHKGLRVTTADRCEKCNNKTNWTVNVGGRKAYWCGCGN